MVSKKEDDHVPVKPTPKIDVFSLEEIMAQAEADLEASNKKIAANKTKNGWLIVFS